MENIPRIHYIGHSRRDSIFLMENFQCEPGQLRGTILFMSMYNDIICENEETENCEMNSVTVANYARRLLLGRWTFLGPGSEKNGTQLILRNQMETGTRLLNE